MGMLIETNRLEPESLGPNTRPESQSTSLDAGLDKSRKMHVVSCVVRCMCKGKHREACACKHGCACLMYAMYDSWSIHASDGRLMRILSCQHTPLRIFRRQGPYLLRTTSHRVQAEDELMQRAMLLTQVVNGGVVDYPHLGSTQAVPPRLTVAQEWARRNRGHGGTNGRANGLAETL